MTNLPSTEVTPTLTMSSDGTIKTEGLELHAITELAHACRLTLSAQEQYGDGMTMLDMLRAFAKRNHDMDVKVDRDDQYHPIGITVTGYIRSSF